jgi:tetratricopeptide (TPR) repeat protein
MYNVKLFYLMFLIFFIFGIQSVFGSTIAGTVYDKQRNPLPDVDIELLDDLSRVRAHRNTDGNGRYEFTGLSDGRYTVRVSPIRYDLVDEERLVEIVTISFVPGQNSPISEIVDFYLSPRRGSIAEVEASVVFAQEIPKEARKVYENAVNDLANKRTQPGLDGLKQAVKIFPNYFLALQRLGREYFLKGNFSEAVSFLLKAAEINNKSPLTFYCLGYSLFKLGYYKAAIVALKQAAFLSPASASVFFTLGTSERLEGQFAEAETHLIKALKLTKGAFPDLHWQLALLFGENLKKYSEAAKELEQFLEERPTARDGENIKKIIKNYRDKAEQEKNNPRKKPVS